MLGILQPSLIVCGSRTQSRSFSAVLGTVPAPSVSRLMRWVRSTKGPHRLRSPDGMTVDTGSGKEKIAAGPHLGVICRSLFLFGYPFGEFLACMHDYAEQHVCMLQATILRAISNIGTGSCGLNPHPILPI